MDFIVVQQIGVGPEVADLHVGAGDETLGIRMEQQHRRPLQVAHLDSCSLSSSDRIGSAQQLGARAVCSSSPASGTAPAPVATGRDRDTRHRHAIPMAALLAQQKPVQRRAFQLLLGAAAAEWYSPL